MAGPFISYLSIYVRWSKDLYHFAVFRNIVKIVLQRYARTISCWCNLKDFMFNIQLGKMITHIGKIHHRESLH